MQAPDRRALRAAGTEGIAVSTKHVWVEKRSEDIPGIGADIFQICSNCGVHRRNGTAVFGKMNSSLARDDGFIPGYGYDLGYVGPDCDQNTAELVRLASLAFEFTSDDEFTRIITGLVALKAFRILDFHLSRNVKPRAAIILLTATLPVKSELFHRDLYERDLAKSYPDSYLSYVDSLP